MPRASVPQNSPKVRADYRANHERILLEAERIIAERGAEVPLEDIIRAASVGPATFYRHFPSRLDMMHELYSRAVDKVLALPQLLESDATAGEKIELFIKRMVELHFEHPATLHVMTYLGEHDQAFHASVILQEPVSTLVAQAKADGWLRSGVTETDLTLLAASIGLLARYQQIRESRGWERFYDVFLRGIKASAEEPSALPGEAFSVQELSAMLYSTPISEGSPTASLGA